jgi:hypothetical protein
MKEKLMKLNELVQRRHKSIIREVSDLKFSKFLDWLPSSLDEKVYKEFQELYKIANGFEFNSLIIYSLDDEEKSNIYDMNNVWHENDDLKYLIFFGDSDISWYCYDLNNDLFCELDKPSGTLMETYKSFSELISTLLDSIM